MEFEVGQKVTEQELIGAGWTKAYKFLDRIAFFHKPEKRRDYEITEPTGKKRFSSMPFIALDLVTSMIIQIGTHNPENTAYVLSAVVS